MSVKPLSPSEIEEGRRCDRKWAFKYNSDTPREETAVSALSGIRGHSVAEKYLMSGAQPDRHDAFGELFIEALPHLPPPRSGTCEGRQEAMIGGLPFVYVQDWYGPSDAIPGAPRGMPATIDHKFSKDPKRYGVWGKAEHLDNPQTLVYLARGASEASEAFGRWLYYRKTTALLAWELATYREQGGADPEVIARYERSLAKPRKPQVLPSDIVLTRDEIRGGLERVVLPVGEKLYRLREKGKVDPLTLPPNPAECEAFGGCPHRKRCNLSVQEQTKGYFSMAENSAPPAFDIFSKLPPVNGPSASPTPTNAPHVAVAAVPPAVVTAPQVPSGHTFAIPVPVWQPPSQAVAPQAVAVVQTIPQHQPVAIPSQTHAVDVNAAIGAPAPDSTLRTLVRAMRQAAAAFVAAVDSSGL